MPYQLFQGGRRRRRRSGPIVLAVLILAICAGVAGAIVLGRDGDHGSSRRSAAGLAGPIG